MYLMNVPEVQKTLLTISGGPGFFDPVCEMPDKVEEKVSFGDRDDLVSDLDKEGEAFGWSQVETLAYRSAKVFGPSWWVHLKRFVSVVWEVNLQKYHNNLCGNPNLALGGNPFL